MIPTERINQIVIEISLGKEPASPYTEEELEFIEKVKPQIAKIEEDGNEVMLPNE